MERLSHHPQMIGIPKFKPKPEPEHARVTAVNFAAEYERSETKTGEDCRDVTSAEDDNQLFRPVTRE